MPIYEYRCMKCGATSEFLVGLGEDDLISCQHCGCPDMERILSPTSFLGHAMERAPGHTCCGREERCETPPCSRGGTCKR